MTDLEERVREVERWAAEHDGKINAKWEEQERENSRCVEDRDSLRLHMEQNFGLVHKELTNLMARVAYYAASATTLATIAAKYLLP